MTETENYSSQQPLSTRTLGQIVSTEDSTGQAPSTGAGDRDTSIKVDLSHHTSSRGEEHDRPASPELFRGTEPLTEMPNATHRQRPLSSVPDETSSSSAPPRTQSGTDVYGTSTTDQSEGVSSTPALVSEASSPGKNSSWTQTDLGGVDTGVSTDATSEAFSTDLRERTGVSSQTMADEEESTVLGLTTAPPTVGASATATDDLVTRFLSGQSPSTTRTDGDDIGLEVLTTMPTAVTHRYSLTQLFYIKM